MERGEREGVIKGGNRRGEGGVNPPNHNAFPHFSSGVLVDVALSQQPPINLPSCSSCAVGEVAVSH